MTRVSPRCHYSQLTDHNCGDYGEIKLYILTYVNDVLVSWYISQDITEDVATLHICGTKFIKSLLLLSIDATSHGIQKNPDLARGH
jgi:hypothetical protein